MNEATIAKKHEEVQVIREKISKAGSTLFVDYLGLTVAEVTELRVKLHAENCEMKVVKNNILRRATEEGGYDGIDTHLVGPSAIVTAHDEVSAAKICADTNAKTQKLEIKCGLLDGQFMSSDEVKALAKIPSREELIGKLLFIFQNPMRSLAVAVNEIAKKNA